MPLEPGTRLGPYEVTAALGAGGMGEVYQARDTALNRDVAIKVLPEGVGDDADRLARFQREAEALAVLNHPNIAQIHGLEQSGDTPAIVMELVEGPTLADRIAAGPIALDEALPIARQIADALEAAHERGVIHRDLKPANVKVKDDGTVKVLDFGLAKAMDPVGDSSVEMANSPTLTARATQMGMILGTAAYMAPEQAKGKHVDKRADVWAFGVVLFEMLTGQRPFDGSDVSEVMARVISHEPDWNTLPAATPRSVHRLLRRCLVKSRSDRLRDIGDARLEIDHIGADGDSGTAIETDGGPAAAAGIPWKLVVPIAVAALLIGALGTWLATRSAPLTPEQVMQFEFELPEGINFSYTGRRTVAIAPDGSRIVFVADSQLWMRRIGDLAPTRIPGTEEARTPFFSPNGQEIGFWTSDTDQFERVAVTGGAPVPVGAASIPYGASWADNGMIYFGQGGEGIWQVPATGGTPEVVIEVEDGERAHGPQLLPGGEWLLFTLGASGTWNEASIVAQSLVNREDRVELITGGTEGRWVPTGHLVYVLDGTLYAVAFDPMTMERPSGPASLVEGVRMGSGSTGAANYGFTDNGRLIYVPGTAAGEGYRLVWVDTDDQIDPLAFEPRDSFDVDISPDGRRIAVEIAGDDGRRDIWIYDAERSGSGVRLTTEANNRSPVWSPDGEWVYFQSDRGGNRGIWKRRADRSLEAELVLEMDASVMPKSISADGEKLLFASGDYPDGDGGILTLEVDQQPDMLVATPAHEYPGDFSPDGSFFTFSSDETGQFEVYVMELATGSTFPVSTSLRGGVSSRWSRDGTEIFYGASNGSGLLAVGVTMDPFVVSEPVAFTDIRRRFLSNFAVTEDGQRFLVTTQATAVSNVSDEATVTPRIRVILNWFEELKQRVPTGR